MATNNFGNPTRADKFETAAETVNSVAVKSNMVTASQIMSFDARKPHNPGADQRAWSTTTHGRVSRASGPLLRGRITQWRKEAISVNGTPRVQRSVNFLYNPTTITHSFSFDESLANPAFAHADDAGQPMMSGQSVSWRLLFTRQYETGYYPKDEEKNIGVLADTQALEYMLGGYNGTQIQAVDVMVVFGATPKMKPFAFYGWITNLNINYLMFNHRMIPTVAEVDIGLAVLVNPQALHTDAPGVRPGDMGAPGSGSRPAARTAAPGGGGTSVRHL